MSPTRSLGLSRSLHSLGPSRVCLAARMEDGDLGETVDDLFNVDRKWQAWLLPLFLMS